MTTDADAGMASRRLELVSGRRDDLRAALESADRALGADGDLRVSRDCFERAYLLAERSGNVQAMARAAIGLAGLWVSERRTVTETAQLEARLQQVLPLLEPDSPLALRIRARLAGEADYRRGERAGILAVLAEARTAGQAVPLAEALSLAHHCLLGPDTLAQRAELATELIKTSFGSGRRSDQLMGLLWQTVDSYAAGDPHAGRLLGELHGRLAEQDHRAVGFVVSAIDVMLAIRAGRLDEAESLAAICASSGEIAGDIDGEWWPGAQLVTIRWYQRRLVELLPLLTDRVRSSALSPVDESAVAALAVAAALGGDRRTAVSCLAALRGRDLTRLPRSSSWLVTLNGIAEAAYLLGDAATATEVYQLLLPYARLPMVGGLGVTCFGSTEQALGITALTAGDYDSAINHLRAAIQQNLALPHWPAVVSARERLARACSGRCLPGDADEARRELAAAASEADALGIRGPDLRVSPKGGSGAMVCAREGRSWRLTLADRSVLIEDSIGMLHLAVLIANPRQDVPAADLVAGLAAVVRSTGDSGQAQPVLDRHAIAEYRSRLAALTAELDELAPAQAEGARVERDWLTAQLASAAGLSGRTRSFAGEPERARVAVGKAIRRALARISEADQEIGAHLRQSVHTGARCSYWPG